MLHSGRSAITYTSAGYEVPASIFAAIAYQTPKCGTKKQDSLSKLDFLIWEWVRSTLAECVRSTLAECPVLYHPYMSILLGHRRLYRRLPVCM